MASSIIIGLFQEITSSVVLDGEGLKDIHGIKLKILGVGVLIIRDHSRSP